MGLLDRDVVQLSFQPLYVPRIRADESFRKGRQEIVADKIHNQSCLILPIIKPKNNILKRITNI